VQDSGIALRLPRDRLGRAAADGCSRRPEILVPTAGSRDRKVTAWLAS